MADSEPELLKLGVIDILDWRILCYKKLPVKYRAFGSQELYPRNQHFSHDFQSCLWIFKFHGEREEIHC